MRRKIIRRFGLNLILSSSWALFALVGFGYLSNAHSAGAFGIVFGSLLLLAGVTLSFRGVRAGILVRSDGLELRSSFRTRRVSWSEYQGARAVSSTGPIPAVVIAIETVDGKVIRVEEVRSFGWLHRGKHRFVDQAIASIEAARRVH